MLDFKKLQKEFIDKELLLERSGKIYLGRNYDLEKEALTGLWDNKIFLDELAKLGFERIFELPHSFGCLIPRSDYKVVAVDGSQIYPSKHEGCDATGLINTAGVVLDFDNAPSTFSVETSPCILTSEEASSLIGMPLSVLSNDVVDMVRLYKELVLGYEISQTLNDPANSFILFDGNLSLEFLKNKSDDFAIGALNLIGSILKKLADNSVSSCSYVSADYGLGFLTAAKRATCSKSYFDRSSCCGDCGNYLCGRYNSDKLFLLDLIEEGESSPVFKSSLVPIQYQELSLPECYFVYFVFNNEIVKIVTLQKNFFCEKNLRCLVDQITKGLGYPLALTEAHASCYISSADKKLFLELLGVNYCKKTQKQQAKDNLFL